MQIQLKCTYRSQGRPVVRSLWTRYTGWRTSGTVSGLMVQAGCSAWYTLIIKPYRCASATCSCCPAHVPSWTL